MSVTSGRLCYLILREVFDESVASVGNKLHEWNEQTLQQLLQIPPRVPKTPEALVVLIHHNLVTFQECPRTGRVIYNILEDRILSLIKFPRYLILCKTLFGDEVIIFLTPKKGFILILNNFICDFFRVN